MRKKLIIPIFVVIFIRQIFGLIRIFKIFFLRFKFYGKQTDCCGVEPDLDLIFLPTDPDPVISQGSDPGSTLLKRVDF